MKTFFKQLFCNHRWEIRDRADGVTIIWCSKCTKYKIK